MLFCVFSFNRGQYLRNAVASIEDCAPGHPIAIFDDNSTDEDTQAVLNELANDHVVISSACRDNGRLGGLYGNMQAALTYALAQDADTVCFLQDDTQLVRPLTDADHQQLEQLLASEDVGFVHPCFLRGRNRERDRQVLQYDGANGIYRRFISKQSAGVHFSALLVTNPKKLQQLGWQFQSSEPANDKLAATMFSPMPYLYAPFAMWLPEVPTYRGKCKTWALKYAEKKRHSGFYPFSYLDDAARQQLAQRDAQILPFAEDMLHCQPVTPASPWAYHPLQDSKLLKQLSSAEVALRRWMANAK